MLAKCFAMTEKYQLFVGSSIFNNINGHLVSGALTPRVQVHTGALILFYSFKIK